MQSLNYEKPTAIVAAPIVSQRTGEVLGEALGCERPNCQTTMPLAHVPENRRAAYAESHGFVQYQGRIFCSRTCLEIDSRAPSGKTLLTPRDQKASAKVTRVSCRDYRNHEGKPTRDIVCDRKGCDTRSRVPDGDDISRILKLAEAAGYVEAYHGTYCSHGCERMVRAEIVSGRTPSHQFGTVRIEPTPVATASHKPMQPPAPPAPSPPKETAVIVAQSATNDGTLVVDGQSVEAKASDTAEAIAQAAQTQRPRWDVQRHGGRRRNG